MTIPLIFPRGLWFWRPWGCSGIDFIPKYLSVLQLRFSVFRSTRCFPRRFAQQKRSHHRGNFVSSEPVLDSSSVMPLSPSATRFSLFMNHRGTPHFHQSPEKAPTRLLTCICLYYARSSFPFWNYTSKGLSPPRANTSQGIGNRIAGCRLCVPCFQWAGCCEKWEILGCWVIFCLQGRLRFFVFRIS